MIKYLLMMMILMTAFSAIASDEMVTIPRQALIDIRNYVVELQAAYNSLVDQLNVMDERVMVLNAELERSKRRASGVWLGAMAGLPFPAASVSGAYIFNNNIGIMLNGGYSSNPYVQAGVMVRVGK